MPESIISGSGTQHGWVITQSGAGLVNTQETSPIDGTQNNAAGSLVYTGDLLTGISKFIAGNEFTKTLAYSGTNNVLVNIGSWSAV